MSFVYAIDAELDLLCVVGAGRASGFHYFSCLQAAAADSAFYYGMDLLVTLQHMEDFSISLDEMNTLLLLDHRHRPHPQAGYRCAVLTRSRGDAELVRVYNRLVQQGTVSVQPFVDLNSALAWMGRQAQSSSISTLLTGALAQSTAGGASGAAAF